MTSEPHGGDNGGIIVLAVVLSLLSVVVIGAVVVYFVKRRPRRIRYESTFTEFDDTDTSTYKESLL